MVKPKVLIFDIETSPNLSYTWGKWEQNVIEFERDWYIMTFCAKWLGSKRIISRYLPHYNLYKKHPHDDKEIVKELWRLFNEADVIVAHNGNDFDIKKANTRFIQHGLTPPSHYQKIDTKLIAKRYFKFDSNKLDDLGKYLKLGRKIDTGGFELWMGCMKGDIKSWNKMLKYNKQDVVLLEKVYLKIRGWIESHPNYNVFLETQEHCPNCGGHNLYRRGLRRNKTGYRQAYQCKECGAWSSGKQISIKDVLK